MVEANPTRLPTLARICFHVPPERMAAFETAYREKVLPVLETHGLTESSERGRPTPDTVFDRLLEAVTPADVLRLREALERDPAWHAVLEDLERAFGAVKPGRLYERHLELYAAPAGPGRTVSAGRGRGHWRTYDATDGLAGGDVLAILQLFPELA